MQRLTILSGFLLLSCVFMMGCPPQPQLAVSSAAHHFGVDALTGEYETQWTFDVWNKGGKDTVLVFALSGSQPWIQLNPATGGQSTGPNDRVTVTVTIDRAYSDLAKAYEFSQGEILIESSVARKNVSVTTAPNYYAEFFNGDIDLDALALTFRPNGGPSFYGQTKTPIDGFPTDPSGGLLLNFAVFGDPIRARLFGNETLSFYGHTYDTLYIGSEGWISFGQSGNPPATFGAHFAVPRISALPVDATQAGSIVSFLQDAEKLVITYENVPTQGAPDSPNNFQIELFFDGVLRISYLGIDPAITGIAGLSVGTDSAGVPPADFIPSDLSNASTAPLKFLTP
jgi:hypothetical protein